MTKEYFVIGALNSETQEVIYLTQEGTATPALYRAYQYSSFNEANQNKNILEGSIKSSYSRFLELVRENAMYPVYTPGLKQLHKNVYESGLRIFSVSIIVEEVSG